MKIKSDSFGVFEVSPYGNAPLSAFLLQNQKVRNMKEKNRSTFPKIRPSFGRFSPKFHFFVRIFRASGARHAFCYALFEDSVHRAGRRPPAPPPDAPCQPPSEGASDDASQAAAPPPPTAGRAPQQIPTPRHLVRNPWKVV